MSAELERQAFEEALRASPEDWDTRLVYADWLEEHDCPEEADRQRQYRDAYEWMVGFAASGGEHCPNYPDDAYDETDDAFEKGTGWVPITFDMVMEAAREWVDTCQKSSYSDDWYGEYFTQLGQEGLRDMMSGKGKEEFWKNFQILEGVHVPPEKQGQVFSCSC